MYSVPNILTLARITMVPLLVGAFFLPPAFRDWTALGLFSAAAATDYLDGWLARKMGQTSSFGRFLDPIADKLLVSSAIVMLIWADRAPVLPALIIVCREILVSGLREFLAEMKVGLPVTPLAKWKTAAQMIAICLLLVGPSAPLAAGAPASLTDIGAALIWVAAGLTVWSGYGYMRTALRHAGPAQATAVNRK